jgi:hypothetical protein
MEAAFSLVPDLSYEPEYVLAHEQHEVIINGAKVVFDRKAPLMPVALEPEKDKKNVKDK